MHHPDYITSVFASEAERRAAENAKLVELENKTAEIIDGLRQQGFGRLADAPAPVSILGSFAPPCLSPVDQLLTWHPGIESLKAQLAAIRAAAIRAAVPPPPVAQVKKPGMVRRVRGFPLSVVCAEAEREECEVWRKLELGLPVYAE